jgi:TatD DNase family protein
VFYDTHAHLDFPDYAGEVTGVLERAARAGIGRVVCIGTDLESSRKAVALSEAHACVYAVVGWHPTHVMEAPEDIREPLGQLVSHPKVVAIGETGLDFYRMPSGREGGTVEEDEAYRRRQRELFLQQLEVAEATGMNVVVHQRGDVLEETLAMMAPFAGRVKGQFHCFGGDTAAMGRILAGGSLVSFTGIVTFKSAQSVRETVAAAPMGRFMLETDCPYLAPVPHRGTRCEPAHVAEIAAEVARVKQCGLDVLSRATGEAAHGFFPKLR